MKTRERREFKWRLVGLAGVFLCVYLGIFVSKWLQPTLADDAVHVTRVWLVTKDPNEFYDYTLQFQREQTRISREQYAAMWRSLVEPRLKNYEVVHIGAPSVSGETQGTVDWEVRDKRSGRTFSWTTAVWNTDTGGQLDLFEPLLLAWWLEYGVGRGREMGTVAFLEAILQGLRTDRYDLERFGIRYRPSQYPGLAARSLEQWEMDLRNRLQRAMAKERNAFWLPRWCSLDPQLRLLKRRQPGQTL
jgi:hypothetical protein